MKEKHPKSKAQDWVVYGRITYSDTGRPAVGVHVTAMDADFLFDDKLGETTTDEDGRFNISYDVTKFRDLFERAPDIYLLVFDEKRVLVTDTRPSVVRNAGPAQEIHVQVPGRGQDTVTVVVGGTPVDRRVFATLEPEEFLKLAETVVRGPGKDSDDARLAALSPELDPKRLAAELCFTPLVRFLRDTVRVKQWPREVSLRLEEILIGFNADAGYATHSCPNFDITYQTSGGDQPPTADTGGNITMPGTGAVVGTTAAGNGVPDYIEKLCFWLDNALAIYTNPPFSLQNPAAGGKIPVNVTGTSAGSAGGGAMTIGRNLNDDLLAAVPTHELMHLIQELYEGAGTAGSWNNGMVEGGAVLGEDVVFDTHNRYIVQATSSGTLASPATALNASSARYYLALLLKYISEQQSSRINPADEPSIGVETYRALLERFDVDGYTDEAFETAVGGLPWYQSFFRFGYLDPGRLDETSSETLLGNFWAACYLKDLGTPVMIDGVAERRFDFMEDEENATWDTIFTGADTVATLGSAVLTSTSTLNAGGNITLSSGAGGSVSPFAARFYKVNVAGAVDTLRVDFTAGAAFTRPIVQILLIEPGNVVRDILRSDRATWSRTIANARGGTSLDHILIIVAGTDTGGTYTLTTQTVAAAPDVMVTRWHHRAGRHFEIDSFGWAWTWASPDIWVDTNMDGVADDEVFFNTNNKLFIRLRNQGHADAVGISVQFWYQDANGGLSDAAWQPVRNAAGVIQTLTGLTLPAQSVSPIPPAAGANAWCVDWAPAPSGTSKHFCVRAVVTVPGDPNTDNKRCLNNFGNVVAPHPYWIDLWLLRRVGRADEHFRLDVIPRTRGRWFPSAADMEHVRKTRVHPGSEVTDVIRIRKRSKLEHVKGNAKITPAFLGKRPCPTLAGQSRRELRPDPFGHYPTDPRALPPGMEKADLITIAHVVDGKVLGGFTWAVRER